jgi:hypothetical protein
LKTSSEALAGPAWGSIEVARAFRAVFEGAAAQEGGGFGVDKLLWRSGEPTFTRTCTHPHGGKTRQDALSALEHWYMPFADARNAVVHAAASPTLVYALPGSAYEGPFVEVADRVLREAIAVELGAVGHPATWRRGLTRARFEAWRRLRHDQS